MRFSHQPVAWLTAIATLLLIVVDVLNGTVDLATAVSSAIVVLSGVITWHKVTPIAKLMETIHVEPSKEEPTE